MSTRSGLRNDGRAHTGPYSGEKTVTTGMPYSTVCGRCGARRSDAQIGLEESPQAYVATLVEVFHEVRRVLRPDGTCWIVIGDAYNAAGRVGHGTRIGPKQQTNRASATGQDHARATAPGLKPKDLIGIPWMLAFALRDAGWYLRQEIIWDKPSAMPESVTDRCTRSHETVFMLAKAERYYYDQNAIREPNTPDMLVRAAQGRGRGPQGRVDASRNDADGLWRGQPARADGRNKRSVWSVNTQPLGEQHYAAFPEKLIEPMILAGTSEAGCCAQCGNPYRRVVESAPVAPDLSQRRPVGYNTATRYGAGNGGNGGFDALAARMRAGTHGLCTVGWKPGCTCDAGTVPCSVLDPFCGSGTTLLVSRRLGRAAIGIELNPSYVELAQRRVSSVPASLFTPAALVGAPDPEQQAPLDF